MKKLIIAEKPSLAITIVKAINIKFQKYNGYFESDDYIVSFAYGHLFRLMDIEEYKQCWHDKYWRLEDIPFVPDEFRFVLKSDKGISEQYNVIKNLASRNDVQAVIHCGDADREGEVIVRLIANAAFNELKISKPILRLWLPEQTEESIRTQLGNLENDNNYENLYQEGLCRTYVDWAYGINFTRLITIKTGNKMPVGRVLVPIVKEIYDRDMAIKAFKKERYYQAQYDLDIDGNKLSLVYDKKFTEQSMADKLCNELNRNEAVINNIDTKDIVKASGKLFSLTTLQNKLSKDYKISMKESLDNIQQLYEAGYITYPRTNTEYLAAQEESRIQQVINVLKQQDYPVAMKHSKAIFDDRKIESHSAITPTVKTPLPGCLTNMQAIIYNVIKNRFICVFFDGKTVMQSTTLHISVGEYEFEIKGNTIKELGFLKYEPQKESPLPPLAVGDSFSVQFISKEKETAPPPKHNISSLNNFLKSPFKKDITDNQNDDKEYKELLSGIEIGTVATRTSIIENAKKYGYISEIKGIYSIEPIGIKLIESLNKLGINLYKDKSIELSQRLKKVYQSQIKSHELCSELKNEICNMIEAAKSVDIEKLQQAGRDTVGKCPRCGNPVYEGEKNFYCSNYKSGCKFVLWKNNKFFEAFDKKITKKVAAALLQESKVKMKGLKSKSGNVFDADICVEWLEPYPRFQLDFPNNFTHKKNK